MDRIAKFSKVSLDQYIADYRKMIPSSRYSDDDLKAKWEAINVPVRSTSGSAGYDFFMPDDMDFAVDRNVFFPTGIRCQINEGWFLSLFPKSGLGTKYGTSLMNTVGIVDSDYYFSSNEGHIMVGMSVKRGFHLNAGDKFMQGIFIPYGITTDDNVDQKRDGGFGSTGK